MITVKNESNSSKYIALFTEAFQFLKSRYAEKLTADRVEALNQYFENKIAQATDAGLREEDAHFTSVQEYFSHLKDIQECGIGEGSDNDARKFLMLPLDEPMFEIDANKRDITVPSEFKKNGISVKGDEIAESLIFRINRFFDYADLKLMKCKIQWINAAGEEGISDAFFVDDTQNAEYLYIMWPLTAQVTSEAGNIKFSVRFYKVSGDTLVYSFSTKVAQATINQGHNFPVGSWSGKVDDASTSFINAIENSVNSAAEKAQFPVFVFNLNDHLNGDDRLDVENYDAEINDPALGHIIEAYIDPEHPTQTLRVQATTGDTGILGYQWQYEDMLDITATGANGINKGRTYYLKGRNDFVEIPQDEYTHPIANKVYYYQTGTNEYSVLKDENRTDDTVIFEKFNIIDVTFGQTGSTTPAGTAQTLPHVVGKYFATAINNVGDNHSDTDSVTLYFPSPKTLEFAEGGNLEDYYFLDGSEGDGIIVTPIIDESAKATYLWCYAEGPGATFHPIFGQTSTLTAEEQARFSVTEALTQEQSAGLTIIDNKLEIKNKPGYYKVIVISTRNYDNIKIESAQCKVCAELQAPVIAPAEQESHSKSTLNKSVTVKVAVADFNNTYKSESISYQWGIDANGEFTPIEGATGPELTVNKGFVGDVRCKVTNHMGTFEAVATSGVYNISTQQAGEDDSYEPVAPELPADETQPVVPGDSEPTEDPTVTPALNITVNKVSSANASTEHPENQDLIDIVADNNIYTIRGNLSELQGSMSSDSGQQDAEHKWIAIDIATGRDSLEGIKWNGTELTSEDVVAETNAATTNGLAAGHLVFFAKADVLAEQDQVIRIGYGDEEVALTFKFVESTIEG